MVAAIEKLIGSSYMLGLIHAEEENPERKINAADETEIPAVPFNEAMQFLKSKVPMSKAEWLELEPKLRFRAFTVAQLGSAEVVNKAKQILVDAFKKDTEDQKFAKTYSETWEELKKKVDVNALGIKPGYWENVFRTNTQSAYIAGKLQQYENTKVAAYQLMVIEDGRTSKICRHLLTASGYGMIISVDHPFWKKYGFPPYHFQCRTSIRAIWPSQVGKLGNMVENPTMKSLSKFKVQEGFGGNPLDKESWWKMTESMIKNAEKFDVWSDILQQAYEMDMISYQKELLKGYENVYKGKHGGYIQMAKNWEFSQKEMNAAQKLADEGHQIYLLPRNNLVKNLKSPDMLIDNQIGEFKHQETLSTGAIEHEIKKAKKQRARIVYLKALDNMTKDDLKKSLKSEVLRSPIRIVYLDWNGKILQISRKAIREMSW
ncbi:MAG: minor capsid protein [Treponemataceae bacterium]|nr:minor capsid protein [Treponemataceae bacterium]